MRKQSFRIIDGEIVAIPGEYDIEIEDKDRNITQGIIQKVQRVDEDGFIKTVDAVEVPLCRLLGYNGPTKTVEVSDFTKKIKINKDGSIETYYHD